MLTQKLVIITKAVTNLTKNKYFVNRWVSSSSLVTALNAKFEFDSDYEVNKRNMNKAINNICSSLDNLNIKNNEGIYRGTNNREKYYWFQSCIADPPLFPSPYATDSWEKIKEQDDNNLQLFLTEDKKQQERKKRSKRKVATNEIDTEITYNKTIIIAEKFKKQKVIETGNNEKINYFESPEARLLFNPIPEETVLECIERRIELLSDASLDDDVLIKLVANVDSNSFLTSKQREKLRTQCIYLKEVYEIAVNHMNNITWKECCAKSIDQVARNIGKRMIKNEKTIRRWNIIFRKQELLEVSNARKSREPKLFVFFPETQEKMSKYCNKLIKDGGLSCELVCAELQNNIVPGCYEKLLNEAGDNRELMPSYIEILSMCDLTSISISTVWNWMQYLGFKYSENLKCYYNDGHEREDVVKDRNDRFLVEYFKLERRCYRWVQLTKQEAENLEATIDNFPKHCYYEFNLNGNDMCEYHIDTHESLQQYIDDRYKVFGGNPSVKMQPGERQVILVGQDESSFHQFTFSKRYWKGPKGRTMLLPKSVGETYMVSGYQSCEFGLGLGKLLNENVLEAVNQKRERYINQRKMLSFYTIHQKNQDLTKTH